MSRAYEYFVRLRSVCKNQMDQRVNATGDDELPEVHESILAFSTIATLLSHIDPGPTNEINYKAIIKRAWRRDLNALDALALLLTRNFEVVAVAANPHYESEQLNLFASVRVPQLGRNPPTDSLDSLTQPVDIPTIVDSRPPDSGGLGDSPNMDLLEKFVDSKPLSLSFESHAWVVSKFLTVSYSLEKKRLWGNLFLRYIIATCFPKILRRLKCYKTLSTALHSLKGLPNLEFHNLPSSRSTINVLYSDKNFLIAISNLETESPIPNIRDQIALAKTEEPFEVYTEQSYKEFHGLLCELLERFENSLEKLAGYQNRKLDELPSDYHQDLHKAANLGDALYHLTRSAAIEKHLQIIQLSLSGYRDAANDRELEEIAEEINDGAGDPLWKLYLNWLHLVVGHVAAVWDLAVYVASSGFRFKEVVIKILRPPIVNRTMLSWEQLIRSSQFPTNNWVYNFSRLTNEEIVNFFRQWSLLDEEGNDPVNRIDELIPIMQSLLDHEPPFDAVTIIEPIVQRLHTVKESGLPSLETYIIQFISSIESLKGETSKSFSLRTVQGLVQSLENVKENIPLFKQLRLVSGNDFTGIYHGELLLASVISLSCTETQGSIYEKCKAVLNELEGTLSLIGSSHGCCQLCSKIMGFLPTGLGSPKFSTNGSPTNITPSDLPLWIPEEIAKEINNLFSTRLRAKMVKTVESCSVPDNRNYSRSSDFLWRNAPANFLGI